MKQMKNFAVLVSSLISIAAWAGGSSDGGGQAVRLDKRKGAPLMLADHFPPANASASSGDIKAEPVDLEKTFPGIKEEVHVLSRLMDRYGFLDKDILFKRLFGGRAGRELDRHGNDADESVIQAPAYYLVKQLPQVPDCQVPRDNSGVPRNATVFHIACTLGSSTYLLDNKTNSVRRLSLSQFADLLAHESFRHSDLRVATQSIETIVQGLSDLRDLQRIQQSGQRARLSDKQFLRVKNMLSELPRAGLVSRLGVSSALIYGSYELRNSYSLVTPFTEPGDENPSDFTVWQNGGALIRLNAKIDPSAYLDVGSMVAINEVSANVVVNRSNVVGGKTSRIHEKTIIERSRVRSRNELSIGAESRIADSVIKVEKLETRKSVSVAQSYVGGHDVQIDDQGRISASEILKLIDTDFMKVDVHLGKEGFINKSTLALGYWYTGDGKIELGQKAQINDSKIFAINLELGERAAFNSVRLSASPCFDPLYPECESVGSTVRVKEGRTVTGSNEPVVILTAEKRGFLPNFNRQDENKKAKSELLFAESVKIDDALPCSGGLDRNGLFTGIVIEGNLTWTKGDELHTLQCKTSNEKRWDLQCSHRFGGCGGLDLDNIFRTDH